MDKAIEPIEPRLTIKQKKFLEKYFELGNGTQAAMQVYNCKDFASAAEIASQNLRKLKNPLKAYMEAKGLGHNALLSVLSGGLKAEKPNEFTGEKLPDHAVRHRYLETAAKWLGVENKSENDRLDNLKKRIVAEEFFES